MQTLLSSSLKLIEFERYYTKPNLPLFFRPQNIQWSCNMVHSHFTLCLRAHDYIKRLSQHTWYGLWMRVKGPHHYKVTTLGSCVKWPLISHPHGHLHVELNPHMFKNADFGTETNGPRKRILAFRISVALEGENYNLQGIYTNDTAQKYFAYHLLTRSPTLHH